MSVSWLSDQCVGDWLTGRPLSRDNLFNCSLRSRCLFMVPLPCSDSHTWEALGRGREGGKRGGVEDRRRGRKSTRNTSCPAGHVSAFRRAFTFYMGSESKSRAAEAAVSGIDTAAVFFFFCHYIYSLLFFLSHFVLFLSPSLEIHASTGAEAWSSP